MVDIMKKYKKQKLITNVNVVLASLVIALWINFTFFNSSNLSQYLTTNVLGTEIEEIKSDISIENIWDEYFIITNKNINLMTSLSLSLISNPQNTVIWRIESNYWDIVNLSNTPWINSLILTTNKEINIQKWERIIKIKLSKNTENSENLNIVNANFTDINNEHFLLTTSWITF